MKTKSIVAVAGVLLNCQPALGQEVEPDVISIPKLLELCETCHGAKGVSERSDVPSLAGQSVDSIMQSMNAFYFEERHCPEVEARSETRAESPSLNMCNISGSLSQTEKMALAEHFAAQPEVED